MSASDSLDTCPFSVSRQPRPTSLPHQTQERPSLKMGRPFLLLHISQALLPGKLPDEKSQLGAAARLQIGQKALVAQAHPLGTDHFDPGRKDEIEGGVTLTAVDSHVAELDGGAVFARVDHR